jgi:hypothetical protein
MLELAAIVLIVLVAWLAFALTVLLIKFIVWLVVLPFRLLFGIVTLPFTLFRVARSGRYSGHLHKQANDSEMSQCSLKGKWLRPRFRLSLYLCRRLGEWLEIHRFDQHNPGNF